MTKREVILGRIGVGDIFNAEDASGPSRICLTTSVTKSKILARSITTQEVIEFDRTTGRATHFWHSARYDYVINSAAQLPPDFYKIMLGIDRKFSEESSDGNLPLTKDQIQAFSFADEFYKENTLPEA